MAQRGARAGATGWRMPSARWVMAAVVVLALVVHLGAIAAKPHVKLENDAVEYDQIAQSVATHGDYPPARFARPGSPAALRPPGYPYLLAATYKLAGHSVTAGRVLGALLGTVAVALIALIAMRLWGTGAGLAAGVLAALYPPLVMTSGSLVSEALFLPLVLGLMLLMLARRCPEGRSGLALAAAAGVLCGLAALTRPAGLVLVIPALLWAWRAPLPAARRLAIGAAVLAALAVTLTPWTVRNAGIFHTLVPLSTQDGMNFAGTYNSDSGTPGPGYGSWRPPFIVNDLKRSVYSGRLDEVQQNDRLRTAATDYIGHHPIYPLEALSLNSLRLFGLGPGRDAQERIWYGEMGVPPRAQPWVRWSVYAMVLLAIAGILIGSVARLRELPLFLWVTPVLLLLSVAFIHGGPRYRLPLDAFLVLAAAAAVPALAAWRSRRRAAAGDHDVESPPPAPADASVSPDAAVTAPADRGRFIAGDPLRAIAALSVVMFHVGLLTLGGRHVAVPSPELTFDHVYGNGLGSVLASGNLGLYIFFVLSGYLIARPFVRAFVVGNELPDLPRYLRNRILRIVPAFWLVFTVLLLRYGALGSSFDQVASVYLFAQNYNESAVAFSIGQAWTLSAEMGFYVLVPLAAILTTAALTARTGPRARLWAVVGIGAAVAVASVLFGGTDPGKLSLERSLPAVLFAFVPGVWLAAIEIEAAPRLRGHAGGRYVAGALVAAAALLVAVFELVDHAGFRRYALLAAAISGTAVAAPLVLQWSTGGCWRVLDNRLLHWVGKRSYSIYLVHLGVLLELGALARVGSPRTGLALVFLAAVPLTIVAAAISYRFFEQPFLRRRERWRRPRPALTRA